MATVLDTGGGYPSPDAIRQYGAYGIMLYVSGSRPGSNFPGKKLTREIRQMYENAGIVHAPVWQYGKPGGTAPSDYTRGYDGGYQDAIAARQKWRDCGGPGWTPFYFAVDEDVTDGNKLNQVYEYFRGAAAAIGKEWVGAYGSKGVLSRLMERDLIGRNRDGKYWAWQPSNWNGGIPDSRITLFQSIIDTKARPGPSIGGIICDVNDVFAADWGQTGVDRAPNIPQLPVQEGPIMQEIDQTENSPNASSRNGSRIVLFVGHTQEGDGTAQSLTNYLKNPNAQVSYHYSCDNQTCIAVVDTDLSSWSVLDANPRCINFCYAGSRANMSRQEWLDRFNLAIDMHAWLFVRDGRKYGLDLRNIGWDEIRSGRTGSTDHMGITKGLGIGNHTDVGPNYPWDVLGAAIAKHAGGAPVPAPVPVKNAIDEKYKTVADKLGKALFDQEKSTPDGRGRYKHYEKGSIYWTPSTGPVMVSKFLFEEWEKREFERGELGYPVSDFAVLNAGKAEPQGEVQGFEKGALYRKYGADRGYYVHGLIFAHWRRADYETGGYGWPVTDEFDVGRGKAQKFERGTISWPNNSTVGFLAGPGSDELLPDVPDKV